MSGSVAHKLSGFEERNEIVPSSLGVRWHSWGIEHIAAYSLEARGRWIHSKIIACSQAQIAGLGVVQRLPIARVVVSGPAPAGAVYRVVVGGRLPVKDIDDVGLQG